MDLRKDYNVLLDLSELFQTNYDKIRVKSSFVNWLKFSTNLGKSICYWESMTFCSLKTLQAFTKLYIIQVHRLKSMTREKINQKTRALN